MQTGDETLPIIISAGIGLFEEIIITLEQHGIF